MRLYVNIDHVATVREARKTTEPDPVDAAHAALRGGADGITVHLREDRRHIQDADVRTLAAQLTKPLNLELAAADEIVRIAEELRPHQATLVPERRLEITTEGGLDIGRRGSETDARLRSVIERLVGSGIRVSLFLDPDRTILDRAAELGVAAVELHTGEYANAWPQADPALARLVDAARHTAELGMAVHAGHGLTYRNVMRVAAIQQIEELNIGHSIVSRSVMTGIEQAVRDMRRAVDAAR
ncbi:MAG: pyridoxine 5'-phosphate synthase [Gemmatimonas sp. SG8_28]|jgi:pyridoxine 5-phosphate synthase|nr:MAG: pyridoxine 5'-phosphate synthase [Gemmatimonas sp. SG8_28]